MKLFSCFVLLVAFYEVSAGTKSNCGNMLVQVLETICTSGYTKIPTKKSVNNDLDMVNMYNDIKDVDSPHPRSIFFDDVLGGDDTNTFAAANRRRQFLGIYEECCLKGCSLREIAAYCN